MSEQSGQSGTVPIVRYELTITPEEALQGITRLLPRNSKRLQVKIPAGVSTGSVVKLSNALQITDGQPGDILIGIKVETKDTHTVESNPVGVSEVNDKSFDSEVLDSALPVAVDFWAPWCGPCRMMAPILNNAAVQYQGKIKFCKINVDENPEMANRYQAMSIPMMLFFKKGTVVEKSVGAIPASQLNIKLDSLTQI
jgi:thioredoxin 1